MLASNMALSGVLMALLRRQTTGKGDYIDVAMMDALIASLPNGYGPPMTERRQPVARHERTWGGNAMYRVYETRRRQVRRAGRCRDQSSRPTFSRRSAGPT